MLVAAELGVQRGTLDPADRDALAALIAQMGPLPPMADLPAADLIQAMARDKKVIGGTLHFVLPAGIGGTRVVTDVTSEELTGALAAITRAGVPSSSRAASYK
jgi:3-dehydroquinate synthase